ncbi:MAG TPA: baseplate J/gp47 family protein [Acidobacteriaceae bacterium]|nr:baseplate J/gp47 family protein [Acidobacteriaceae bacterium]
MCTDASCSCSTGCTCGCCSGTSVQTPQPIANPPGQPAIAYRTGTWAQFNESMLARLSSASYPALSRLKTRDNDDFTIAFLDASAVMFDILSFYQERLANESYLATAQQLQSLTELSRLIGYQPAPGIAASVYLAFTLKAAPNAPTDPTTPPITIPASTQVQSVAAQGQTPQTFETSAAIAAKPDWNALPILAALPWANSAATGTYLQGTATQLNPGDLILMLGTGRTTSTPDTDWSVQFLTTVTVDTANNRTWIAWDTPIQASSPLVTVIPQIYAFRQRAALFAYNAIQPWLIDTKPDTGITIPSGLLNDETPPDWAGLQPGATTPGVTIDFDSTYSKVVTNGWVALLQTTIVTNSFESKAGTFVDEARSFLLSRSKSSFGSGDEAVATYSVSSIIDLYQVSSVATVTRNDCGMTAKITRVTPDTQSDLTNYNARTTAVFAQTDLLTPAVQPLDYPLYGTLIDIQTLRPDLLNASVIAISGTAQKITLKPGYPNLQFVPDQEGQATVPINPGDTFTLIEPPPLPFNPDGSIPSWSASTYALTLKVMDASGRTGTLEGITVTKHFEAEYRDLFFGGRFGGGHGPVETVTTTYPLYLSYFTLTAPSSSDPEISECVLVTQTVGVMPPGTTAPNGSVPHTQFQLTYPTVNCYCRATTTANANVALATVGASVTEIMGNGSAATTNQTFTLRQKPLTYVQANTPNGRQSTLMVRANGVAWSAVPTLYDQPATAQAYTIANESDGSSDVIFGDGVEGATLPTGQNNIIGYYRTGSGSAGNVPAGAITTLMQRPLGVSGVTNPQQATGGADAESIDDVRTNAPQTVLTLGRAVSVTDYQNFAATFAGIAEAYAIWIPSGTARGVYITVAADGGTDLAPSSPTLANLISALQTYSNPLIPVSAVSFMETLFGFSADVKYNPSYSQPAVQSAIWQTVVTEFSFANRTFGQGVSADEIATVIQGVAGVVAVNVTGLTPLQSSTGGDLANLSGGFTVSNWNTWMSQQVANVPRPSSDTSTRICPYIPLPTSQGLPLPAEILVLSPDPTQVTLGVMS